MTALDVRDLRRSYGDVTALADLSLSVADGELFGFLGPNGAGKTTTIKILTGQLTPDGGTAEVAGADPVEHPLDVRERIGILPEQESPPSFLTPREYFQFVGDVRDLDESRVAEATETWADRLGFAEKLDTLSTDLSRGQQQKVMITQAFLHDPGLVFIDEPLVNLDPIVQERFKAFLTDYTEAGNTVFLSTHDIDVAEDLCTRVGVLSGGELVATRRPSDLDEGESLLDLFLEDVDAAAMEA
ncbi:ABC transporter ATP-binding protein [Halocalculus aciditolerans]|uniref:ABC transporter ATP-binding protein n=1 Tax=Halocalculus aciditolerans TaxID=1383812 RepID=A0A830FC63_9EURY|nr:ABC transporter ATP-binding protein [Halocalculus aciditolerans]GGL59917.1 ABC transporter ATP-binding protein [Halocalculus aciditolerans]